MVMNNTLIMLEKTIRHHKLNSSEPNKCNNYDTATQWKTIETEMSGFCVGVSSIIPICVRIYRSLCSSLHALRESEYCLWCILSNIIKRKQPLPLASFSPGPFELKPLLEMQSDWAQRVLKRGQRAGKTVWCHGNLMPPTKNLQWLVGPQEGWSTCHSLLKTESRHSCNWIKHWVLKDEAGDILYFINKFLLNCHSSLSPR